MSSERCHRVKVGCIGDGKYLLVCKPLVQGVPKEGLIDVHLAQVVFLAAKQFYPPSDLL